MKRYWVYIVSNKSKRLYVGFTDDIIRRVFEHKQKIFPSSFIAQHVYDILVFYEEYHGCSAPRCARRTSRDGAGRRS